MVNNMDTYALVLNAGSSSLKFCVYQSQENRAWPLASRGQIDGIGTTPRFTAKDGEGALLDDRALESSVRDGNAALDVLAAWLRSHYGGSPVVGVGHRVVDGGGPYTRPPALAPRGGEGLR